jgi:excisionase family DNA binding protein
MFFRGKRSGDREYLQLVENRWKDGRAQQKVLATVGRLDKLRDSGELASLSRSVSRFCTSSYSDISYGDDELCLSSHQAGRLLQVSPSTVVAWINQGKLEAFRTPGGHRRVRVAAIRRFLVEYAMPSSGLSSQAAGVKRIFVVDDEPAVLRAIQRSFEKLDSSYAIDGCHDGIEALVRIGADIPDLVLLDLYMEGIDGFEVCRRLRRIPELEGLQIVAMTAQPSEDARARILEYGATAYWVKPVRPEQLVALFEPPELPRAQLDERPSEPAPG